MDWNEDRDSSEASGNESEESEEEVQEIKLRLIVKPKTKSVVWNFFHIKSDSDGCPSNTNKPICCKCLEPVAPSYGNKATFLIIYVVNILWFMPKFTIRRNLR